MSFGNSFNGGRTRMKTKVLLNIYDLSPANDYLFPIGLGLYHSGLEISGREYSYGSGGSGIFETPPKEAPGARFRCQVDLGSFDGGTKELNEALDDLRSNNGGFGSNGYHLVKRNCNHFCNALCRRLLGRPIPAYVNRLADIGNCCSCLLPKQLLEDAPVGEGGRESLVVPTGARMSRDSDMARLAFAGKGHSLGGGGGGESTTSMSSSSESDGLFSRFTRVSSVATSTTAPIEDLNDRREKARKAALARLERNKAQQMSDKQS